jgi:ATP-binding cassette, subfamily B, bacterial HlyB/CyaB
MLSTKEVLWLLGSFCALTRKSFDPELFVQRYPPPHSEDVLAQAAADLGLQLQQRQDSLAAILAWRLPVAVQLKSATAQSQWALVLNTQETQVSLLEPGDTTPQSLSWQTLEERFTGKALALLPQGEAAHDPDDIAPHRARFSLRWFIPEILKHRRLWREVLLASLVLQLMALAIPLFTQTIIDKVVVHRTTHTLIALAIGLGIFWLFTGALSFIRQYLILHTGQRIDAVLGAQVFEHMLRLPLQYFQVRPIGVIAARLQGIETIRQFIASSAVTLILDLPFLLIFITVMLFYSVPLTLMVLGILSVITALSLLVAPLFQKRLNEQFLRGAANQAFLTEYLTGIETVKSLQLEPQLNQRYRGQLTDLLKASFATRQLANTYHSWTGSLEQLMTLLILLVGAWVVMHSGTFTVGMLVAFQMLAARISQPILRLVGLWQEWQQARLSIARLGDIMNAPGEVYSLTPRRSLTHAPGRIEIEGLAFRYHDNLPYLFENFNLLLKPGRLVALMGPSGAGKSTLAKLLQGFHAPSSGRIRIDGIDHNHLSANELRSVFGVVPQETVLFSGTILENLKLANPYASFEQVVAACRMAEIHSVIETLPQGYETAIGERGVGLSGGQRQRLAIARALLKGPKVLIFDEATSSVDPATAEQLGRTISSLKGKVTILFIAHQLPKSLKIDAVVRIGAKLSLVTESNNESPIT